MWVSKSFRAKLMYVFSGLTVGLTTSAGWIAEVFPGLLPKALLIGGAITSSTIALLLKRNLESNSETQSDTEVQSGTQSVSDQGYVEGYQEGLKEGVEIGYNLPEKERDKN